MLTILFRIFLIWILKFFLKKGLLFVELIGTKTSYSMQSELIALHLIKKVKMGNHKKDTHTYTCKHLIT